jgi:hypothetical protein
MPTNLQLLDFLLSPTNKKSPQNSQNSPTSMNSKVFSNCVHVKNSQEKLAEILPASSTRKIVRKLI